MASPEEAKTAAIRRPCTMVLMLLWLGPLALFSVPALGQDPLPTRTEPDGTSSSSFVLADPNSGAPQSAYSPPAVPSPVAGSTVSSSSTGSANSAPSQTAESQAAPAMAAVPSKESVGGSGTGGYGSLMGAASAADPLASPMGDSPQQFAPQNEAEDGLGTRQSDPNSAKRHQFSQYAVAPAIPMPEPAGLGLGLAPAGPAPAVGTCPGGASLPIECDPKRPWPQCPPQSYCYATNTVDIGPYFCCPIWSTYGAAWRPATPFYSYAPPPPPNWPEPMRMAAAPPFAAPLAPIRKGRKEQRFDDDGQPLMTEDEQRKILQVMNDWVERQKGDDATAQTTALPERSATTSVAQEAGTNN